ncbi:MAG: amidohydrolase, partial [Acidobacteriota bacterium]
MRRTASLLALLALCATLAHAETIAFVGGTVHPVSGPAISNATLVIDGDTITSITTGATPPADARVVDVSGKNLYPGFILPISLVGITGISSVRGTEDYSEIDEVNSDLRAEVAFNPDSFIVPTVLRGGIAYAQPTMRGGTFTGTSAVLRLDGWHWEDMTVATPVGMHLVYPRTGGGDDRFVE